MIGVVKETPGAPVPPPPTFSVTVLLAVFGLVTVTLGAALGAYRLFGMEALPLIGIMATLIGVPVLALVNNARIEAVKTETAQAREDVHELHLTVNSRMDGMMKLVESSARAQGEIAGALKERDAAAAALKEAVAAAALLATQQVTLATQTAALDALRGSTLAAVPVAVVPPVTEPTQVVIVAATEPVPVVMVTPPVAGETSKDGAG